MRTAMRTGARVAGALLVGSLLGGNGWAATPCGAEMPCSFGISDTGIQLNQGMLKFQARLSQNKSPIPEGVLLKVSVNLVDPSGNVKCTQAFNDLKVMNSVLNIDFHPSNCALDDVVGTNPDLSFQLVLGGTPVKSIPIGTVPYALKANRAVKAQEAHHADVAAQAHYAHRITADRETLKANAIGKGYFDFYTLPDGGSAGSLYDATSYSQYAKDGFIQWTPVQGAPALHIGAKDLASDQMAMLDRLHLESKNTVARGSVVIAPEANSNAARGLVVQSRGAAIGGGAWVSDGLWVSGNTNVNDGVFVSGAAEIAAGLTVTGGVTVKSGGASVIGKATFADGAKVSTGLEVSSGGVNVVAGGLTVQAGGASVSGKASFTDGATVASGLDVTSGGLKVVGGDFSVQSGTAASGPARCKLDRESYCGSKHIVGL